MAMGIGKQLKQLNIWLDYGSRLLWLRLRMLRLDAVAQIRSVVLLFGAALAAAVVFFLGFISLLFGLNSVLDQHARIWVFFGLAALFGLVLLGLAYGMVRLWRQQGRFMSDTLDAMADDVAYLHGRGHRHEPRCAAAQAPAKPQEWQHGPD